jgi:hypothetical protein
MKKLIVLVLVTVFMVNCSAQEKKEEPGFFSRWGVWIVGGVVTVFAGVAAYKHYRCKLLEEALKNERVDNDRNGSNKQQHINDLNSDLNNQEDKNRKLAKDNENLRAEKKLLEDDLDRLNCEVDTTSTQTQVTSDQIDGLKHFTSQFITIGHELLNTITSTDENQSGQTGYRHQYTEEEVQVFNEEYDRQFNSEREAEQRALDERHAAEKQQTRLMIDENEIMHEWAEVYEDIRTRTNTDQYTETDPLNDFDEDEVINFLGDVTMNAIAQNESAERSYLADPFATTEHHDEQPQTHQGGEMRFGWTPHQEPQVDNPEALHNLAERLTENMIKQSIEDLKAKDDAEENAHLF